MLIDIIRARIIEQANAEWDPSLPRPHRALQQHAEACTYAALLSISSGADPERRWLDQAADCLAALAAQQGRAGLFVTGDNVESPPDSAFTANGLARLVRVCREASRTQGYRDTDQSLSIRLRDLADAAIGILQRLAPGLLTGGVHTPNHRWELASALAQVGAVLGDERYAARADEWLAEGIDLQEDGLYSERSPNYAAFVTNPCLLVLAEVRGRPDLVEIVHANLHALHLLTDRTGRVETLQSRRQDQKIDHFSAGHFAWLYRVLAHRVNCGECGAAAMDAEKWGGADRLEAAAGALLHPELLDDLPVRPRLTRTGWTVLETSQVAIHRTELARMVVRAAPDVSLLGRVASGAAANPTFAHLRLGPDEGDAGWSGVWLSSMRLSRSFFGMGPFRADTMQLDRGRLVLRETKAAAYYQPSTEPLRYEFEGRFAAEMGFDARRQDWVTLETEISVTPEPDGCDLSITTHGPVVPHHLELAFAEPDLNVRGAAPLGTRQWVALGPVTLEAPGVARVQVVAQGVGEPYLAPAYDPGEAYTYLGGTDAVGGLRLYVPLVSPGELRVRITIEPPSALA